MLISNRELSLTLTLVFVKRRPPTQV